MLTFILGKPKTGKTTLIINKIKELSEKGGKAVFVVPEQFTFETERAVLKALGDKASLDVTVLSFSRLCDEIGNISGGIAGKLLGDADKVIFMHRALSSLKGELKLWGRYTDNVNFSTTMLDTIGEFKINAITPEEIRKASEKISLPSLKAKLLDIALIYESYDMLVGERFIDPADRLSKLYSQLENTRYFDGKTVFIDSFKGFTGQQYKIIERIFSQADNVYVSFTDNIKVKKEYSIYANIRKAEEKIKNIALKYKKGISDPIILDNSYCFNDSLDDLEELLSSGTVNSEKDIGNGINLVYGSTVYDEAEFTARTIRKLVRTKGLRYRDFVIIARELEAYEEAVANACKKNGISCFYDKRMPLSDFPLTVAVQTAVSAIKFSTENILRFHKTGLGTLSYDEISVLENYTYLWNIEGVIWQDKWDMNPRGFETKKECAETVKELEEINNLREMAIKPLVEFKNSFSGSASDMARAIIKLFRNCNVGEKLKGMVNAPYIVDMPYSEDLLRQAYDIYMDILDSLVISFGDATISADSFMDALNIAVSKASVGVIPQCLDQVSFGSADRIRPSSPKYAFILGANQGEFPKNAANSGIFNISERKELIEYDINIEDNSLFTSIEESYLVYSNLCCPTDGLYISCHSRSITGEKTEPSAFFEDIKENIKCSIFYEPSDILDKASLPETGLSLYSEYCKRLRNQNTQVSSLGKALQKEGFGDKLEFIENMISDKPLKIENKTALELYGNEIYMSATKFDTFNRCRFSHFCRYGLGAKKLQPADFDVLQRGTIVHYVLERFITDYGKGISELADAELERLTDLYIDEYLDSVSGFRSVETARTRFLVSRVSRSLKEVVKHLAKELGQSDFEPVACEMKIGKDGIPLEFGFENGKILINGSIDRVDEYNGYIRIVDYKTGSKSFKLPDILFGLNLQMLLYLYAVTRARDIPDSKSAGILYMPSKRDINGKGMAMNGLINMDSDLSYAMDKSGTGEFVPKLRLNSDGSVSKLNKSYISGNKFGEIFDYIEKLIKKTGEKLLSGDIAVSPMDGRESKACAYCDFASVCRAEDIISERVPDLNNDDVFEAMKGDEESAD